MEVELMRMENRRIDRWTDERIKLVISANLRIPISGNAANEFSSRVNGRADSRFRTGQKQKRRRWY